jgi:hypothetical protein
MWNIGVNKMNYKILHHFKEITDDLYYEIDIVDKNIPCLNCNKKSRILWHLDHNICAICMLDIKTQ